MSSVERWLTWKPSEGQIIREYPREAPSKPTFDGFEGTGLGNMEIIQGDSGCSKVADPECPYSLPQGLRLIRYTPKRPPVAVTVCSVVNDPDKFIRHALAELNARLHRPTQIKADDSVFQLLSKLAECGLEVSLEWHPKKKIMGDPAEGEPSKPSKARELNAGETEITDEDISS